MTSSDRLEPEPAGRLPRAGPPRVYLHIGEPKTGTTFLQNAMWANRAELAAQGAMLTGYSHRDHSLASRDLRQAPRLDSDPAASWVGEWDVLSGQALRARGAAVISDELLVACTPQQADRGVRSLLSAEVHVVLTVRDVAALLPAEWQETVKCGGTVGWEEWLKGVIEAAPTPDRRRQSWFWTVHGTLANLGMWSQHIPPDQVHVIILPRQGPAGALWAQFAAVLGIDPAGADVRPERLNPSLGPVEAECLRRMNEVLPGDLPAWFYTRNIKQILAHDALSARQRQARLVLPPEYQGWAREQAEILVAGLRDAKYDIVGELSDLLPAPAADSYVAPGDLAAEQLLDAALHAAAALADQQYRESYPAKEQRQRTRNLRQLVSRLEWTMLNGPRTRRVLRNASNLSAVRWLRVAIWRMLMRPGRAA